MQRVIGRPEHARRWGQRLGPYLAVVILLAGGTLFALLRLLYQRRKALAPASIDVGAERLPT